MSITLDKEKGLNAHTTLCIRCKGSSNSIVLLGNNDYIFSCTRCDATSIGPYGTRKCKACNSPVDKESRRQIQDHEQIPQGMCDSCTKELNDFTTIVKNGGVYFKCTKCKAGGVIKAETKLAMQIRKNYPAPDPIGIELLCPGCE